MHSTISCVIVLAIAVSAVHGTSPHTPHNRRLLIRPFPLGQAKCRNTIAGPLYYADDRGTVCTAKDFDYSTGCCRGGKQHSCDRCASEDHCCDSYEHCVSCCVSPTNQAQALMKEVHTVRGDPSSPLWPDSFEFCRFYCRTHGRSTSHENSYIGARHHCFSKLGKPMMDPPLAGTALSGITLTMGTPGANCDATCQAAGQTCSAAHLTVVNSCDQLRTLVNCEAGCVQEAAVPTMPYYVDGDAPKPFRPALCLVANKGLPGKEPSCSSSDQQQRRLCPCKAADVTDTAAPASTAGQPAE